jgi:hypothetical protein
MSLNSLFNELKINKLIHSNKKKFIEHRNLYKVNLKKNFNEDDLPIDITMGSSFLINNNNIIEIYSYVDHGYSQYIQINKKIATWIARVDIINVEKGDPYNIKCITNGFKLLYTPSDLIYMITEFIHDGFELYIMKPV